MKLLHCKRSVQFCRTRISSRGTIYLMSIKIENEKGELVRYFQNLIDASIFIDATVDEIEVAMENGDLINGYFVRDLNFSQD